MLHFVLKWEWIFLHFLMCKGNIAGQSCQSCTRNYNWRKQSTITEGFNSRASLPLYICYISKVDSNTFFCLLSCSCTPYGPLSSYLCNNVGYIFIRCSSDSYFQRLPDIDIWNFYWGIYPTRKVASDTHHDLAGQQFVCFPADNWENCS